MKTVICVFILGLTFSFNAMASSPKVYIEMEPGFFDGGPSIIVNGEKAKLLGLFSSGDLAERMKDNPLAAEYAEKYATNAHWAMASLFGGLGGALIYMAASRPNIQFGTYWGIFGVGLISSIVFQKAANAYFFKAINTYNGVGSNKTSQLDFSITPIQSGGVLGLNYSF